MGSILRLGLKTKFALLVLVPLGALVWFQITTALERRADADAVADLEALVLLSDAVGDLLHETQKERGATSVYMSSEGDTFELRLLEQRMLTNDRRSRLFDFLDEHAADLPPSVQAGLVPALDELAVLDDRREVAIELGTRPREVIDYFTDMNEHFLDALAAISQASPNAELTRSSAAYLAFVQAKEATGIERAQLANVFGQDHFDEGQFADVVELIATREALHHLYVELASPEMLERFLVGQADPVVAEVVAMEQIAVENGDAGFGIDSAMWFDTITKRIDLLKEVEDAHAEELLSVAAAVSASADEALRNATAVAVVVTLVVALLTVAIVRQIVGELHVIATQAERIAAGDLAVEDLDVTGEDVIADLGRSFNQMSTTLRRISDQMTAVAAVELESPSFDKEVPGDLGEVVETLRSATRQRSELERRAHASARRAEELLKAVEIQAREDGLTGLANRAALEEALDDRLAVADSAGALLIMDLDRFKDVNDTLGHHFGDRLLRVVANRMVERLGPNDLAARLGGDEFAVILDGVDDEATIVDRVGDLTCGLARTVDLDGVTVDVGVSIGIVRWPLDGDTRSELIRRADIAMYEAKRTHQASARYTPQIDHSSTRRFRLMSEIRDAIADGQMVLHYQPQVTTVDQELTGAEALVRWEHPVHGLIPPNDFVALAERSGASADLTRFVLGQSISSCAKLRAAGIELVMAANLTSRDLLDPELPSVIAGLLESHGLPGSSLVLEITEGSVIVDVDRATQNLARFRELGCRTSVDDFGTGYSSLSFLRRLPIDEVKLDRSFVAGSTLNANDEAIVRATIRLVHDLGLEVVAEGVEDNRTVDLLRSLSCDRFQGYLVSRPVPYDDFVALALTMIGGTENIRPIRPGRIA